MNVAICGSSSTEASARLLASTCKVPVTINAFPKKHVDVAVSFGFGCSYTNDGMGMADKWVNDPRYVRVFSNKSNASVVLLVSGVNHPLLTRLEFPAILRRQRHMDGSGLRLVNNEQELEAARAESPMPLLYKAIQSEPTGEIRVHVWDGKPIRLVRRVCDDPVQVAPHIYVRTTSNGWTFRGINKENWKRLKTPIEYAVKSVKSVGWNFGAVDLVQDMHTEHWHVLEVNSGPELLGATLSAYAEVIEALKEE